MRRSIRLAILAAVAGVGLPVVASQTAVSAVDQDLVLSAASGAPGDEIEVTSASCDTSNQGDTLRYLYVRLVAGTAPDAMLAGTGFGIDDEPARLVLPDWTTPGTAAIEASCVEIAFPADDNGEPVVTQSAYDPVAFDLLAGAGTPVQTRVYGRTSLQAGQAFSVTASGCFLDAADHAYIDIVPGDDLAFSELTEVGFTGEGEMDGDSFEALAAMSNGTIDLSITGDGSGPEDIAIHEIPTDIPAGTYSTVAYCTREDGATLMFEPQAIEITGDAPFGDIDLTTAAATPDATLAGGSCTAGDVSALLFAEDLDELFFDPGNVARTDAGPRLSPAGFVLDRDDHNARGGSLAGAGARTRLIDTDSVDALATPAADGSWSLTDQVAYDRALIGAYAACGDPLGDGFIYDPQAAVLALAEVVPPTPTVPPTPAPVPANAVSGTPTYAG